jgi:hypothetical protein
MSALAFDIQASVNTPTPALAELTNSVVLEFNFPSPVVTEGLSYDSVAMLGLSQYGAPGEPILPFKLVKALISQGKDVQSVGVTTSNRKVLEGSFNVEYSKTPVPISSNITVVDKPNQVIYNSANPYPGMLFSQMSEQCLRGYKILLLRLHPVQYIPKTNELFYFETMTVTIRLKETGKISSLFRKLLQDRALALGVVDNPDGAETYTKAVTVMRQLSLVDPLHSYDYVVITNNALKSSFQPLVDWKIQKGLNATIVLVEDIMNDPAYHCDGLFGDGLGSPKFNDTQAHIRNFIKDAYQNWGTQYVLLGGDDEIIPSRGVYVYADSYTDYNIPCDMYYGALDGSWDNDNDAIFGEAVEYWSGPENGTAGEEADFFAEVYVGRATVDTVEEATIFVSKTLAYEQAPNASYLKKALMIGQKLDSITEGGNGKDLVTEIIRQHTTTRLYDRDGTFSRTAVIGIMNSGVHIVNHDGHANYVYVMGLSSSDVDSLVNTEYFLAYSLGCYSAAFDEATSGVSEAIAEHFITSNGGAFAYIGNSRYGWYFPGSTDGPGELYDRSFFSVLTSGTRNLGKALQLSKEQAPWIDRWTYFDLNLLGDPETEIVTAIKAPTAHFQTRTDLLTPPRIGGLANLQGTARRGTAASATFNYFTIEFGYGISPTYWMSTGINLTTNGLSEVINGTLATWDTSQVTAGTYTLKLSVFDVDGLVGEDRWAVLVSTGWAKERVVYSDTDAFGYDCRSSIATDGFGNLFVANDYYNMSTGYYEIQVSKSSDGGNSWTVVKRAYDSTHNVRYPSITIDPYSNDIFVAVEREWTPNDHDIFVVCRVNGVWSWSPVANVLGSDDRFPSITSEYQYGSANWQYISYEYVYTYDDRDLMFASSTDHGANWSVRKLWGSWPDYNVHAQTCITNAEGYIYIAYKWGADYNSPCEIILVRSTDFGNTWTQLMDVDGLPNGCSFPSIAATHGGGTVLVAFQYDWSADDIDVWYSYSTDKGTTWVKGCDLFISGSEDETMPAIVVDGQGMSGDSVMGYFHAVCQSAHYVGYKKAHYNSLPSWSQLQIADEKWIYSGLAITTQFRNGTGQFYPSVTWIDDRPQSYGYGYTLYYSTPGADIYFNSDPPGRTLEIDGNAHITPVKLNRIAGYNHTVNAPSPQYAGSDTRFAWTGWSDLGAQTHEISAGTTDIEITANYKTQYYLTVNTDPSGLTPQPEISPPELWYDNGTFVTCTAQTVSRYTFDHWTVDETSQGQGINPITIIMNEPHTAIAHYSAHDIATTNVTPSKTVIGQNYSLSIYVTVENQGDYTETFNVTARADPVGISDGLVGYWSFDEGSGTTASDSSGNRNDGTVYGANWTDGKFGKALSFDGIDDYVTVPASLSFNNISDAVTIAAWVKLEQVPAEAYELITAGGYSYVAYAYVADAAGVRFNFARITGPGVGDDLQQEFWKQYGAELPYLPYNQWYYVVWMYDSSGYTAIYVNGNPYANTTLMSGKIYNFGWGLTIDAMPLHKGILDELRIYNRTLNQQEIRAGAGAGSGAIETQTATLLSGSSATVTFTWNTSGFAKGNYTIWAHAEPVSGETDIDDNTYTNGIATVTIPGDVEGDFEVNILDVVKITSIYASKIGDPQFRPNSDIDNDDNITILDVVICTSHYAQKYP